MFELFGVNSIDTLKEKLKNCIAKRDMQYTGSFRSAPAILACVKLEEIGSMN